MLSLIVCLITQPPEEKFARWEKSVVAIEERLTKSPPKPGAVFFAGSSSVVGWDLKKSFPDKDYVKVGFGGSQIPDSTHFAPRILAPHKPGAVVFYAGDNDINAKRTPEQVADDFKAFCAAVHKDAPKCRVLFVAVKPSIARWKLFDTQKKANALVKAFCEKDERLAFIDIVPLMLGSDGMPIPELFQKDGLHMTPAGYEKWTAAVNKVLK
ncbi:MAG TPA: GDSL-type esterase/lipase family protein [Gemmataceae bacterium]|nr:GDSL-type esterase/lipase family protein [Gemmataceae bacterium]